jgi:uncharacterized membrane protein
MAEETSKEKEVVEGKKVEGKKKASSKSSKAGIGLEPNVINMLAYLLAPLSGIVFLITEKETSHWKKVRMHVLQSIALSLAAYVVLGILSFVPFIGCLTPILGLGLFVYIIYLAVQVYQGEDVTIPVITDMVKDMK